MVHGTGLVVCGESPKELCGEVLQSKRNESNPESRVAPKRICELNYRHGPQWAENLFRIGNGGRADRTDGKLLKQFTRIAASPHPLEKWVLMRVGQLNRSDDKLISGRQLKRVLSDSMDWMELSVWSVWISKAICQAEHYFRCRIARRSRRNV
jgi:hypothetical protein